MTTSAKRTPVAEQDMAPEDELRKSLAQAIRDSRMYFSIAALPQSQRLRALITSQQDARLWTELPPLEQFFVYAIDPSVGSSEAVARAYCAALGQLPADWWGLPGSVETDAARSLVALGRGILPCLVSQFDSNSPLSFHDGESNAMVEEFELTVGDLAAGFAASILGRGYDYRATPEERRAEKERLKSMHAADE